MAALTFNKLAFLVNVILVFCIFRLVVSAPNVNIVSYECSNRLYDAGSTFSFTLETVLTDLKIHTATAGYDYYGSSCPAGGSLVYGHGVCSESLSMADCNLCMNTAYWNVLNKCSLRMGAQMQLQDCRMRYEDYEFKE